jgi:hypothetical protein
MAVVMSALSRVRVKKSAPPSLSELNELRNYLTEQEREEMDALLAKVAASLSAVGV